jgi:hypothetical protein
MIKRNQLVLVVILIPSSRGRVEDSAVAEGMDTERKAETVEGLVAEEIKLTTLCMLLNLISLRFCC